MEVNLQMKDPVCGMNIAETSKHKSIYESKTYYFCSNACNTEFNKNPKKYAKQ